MERNVRRQANPYAMVALTTIERALDAIEDEGDEEAREWIENPTTGRLPLEKAAPAGGTSVGAVQREARERLGRYHAPDDPIEHDEIDDLAALHEHAYTWIPKSEAADLFDVSMSSVGWRVDSGRVDSVLAPRGVDDGRPVRYVPLCQLRGIYN